MKILAVIADDITINSSANLCHLAYLRGMLENGYQVDLISAQNNGDKDQSMNIPKEIQVYSYDGVSLYEKLSPSSSGSLKSKASPCDPNSNAGTNSKNKKSILSQVISYGKEIVRSLYGVYGFKKAFVGKALRFRNKDSYDYVLSFSYPQASHLLTYKLINRNHINANHWIQIWEDPWNADLYSKNSSSKISKEENRLLSYAEKVCYVTPLTLLNQQKMYPKNSHKMFWLPLPAYYQNVGKESVSDDKVVLGYFGDYYPYSRNLRPFYDTAVKTGIETYICGNPSDLFSETENVRIIPRLSVTELKSYEDRVNTLVFVCNLGGGQVPGKIYQYSATNKRILFILDGNEKEQKILYDYFSKFNRYYFCENNKKSIFEAINRIVSNDNSINNNPVDYFEPKNIAKMLLEKGK